MAGFSIAVFQILLTAYPEVQSQLDLDALNVGQFSPGAQVWTGSAMHQITDPFREPQTLLAGIRSPIGTWMDKLRVLQLRRRVRSGDPRDLLQAPETTTREHLEKMGFSPTMQDLFFTPLFAGIQLDPKLETSSRMFDIIFRSLSEGASVVPANGMGAIPAQLAGRISDGTISLDTEAVEIAHTGTGATIQTSSGMIKAQHVVVATEAPAAASLLDLSVPESRHVGCVWFGADQSPAPDRRIILDGANTGPAHNVAVLSDVAPSYAPPGKALVAAACVADTSADLDERVRQQLRGWFGAVVDDWETLRVDRIAHGQPSQTPPFAPKQRVRLADRLWVCGDHRDTGSIQGAMYSGRRAGAAIAKALA